MNGFNLKRCSRCSGFKDASQFRNNKARKDGLSDWCKPCNSEHERSRTRKRNAKHKPRDRKPRQTPEMVSLLQRTRRYGLTLEDFDLMRKAQGDKCAICGAAPKRKFLVIDHCHETGRVRGLLCSNCNTGIGMLRDSVDILLSATAYLEA